METKDRFRIVETFGRFGNSFHIEENVMTNKLRHKLFGSNPKYKWKELRFEYYGLIVNKQYGFLLGRRSFSSIYGAENFLKNYIEFLEAKSWKYKGFKFHPMFFYNHHNHSYVLYYYDKKSHVSNSKFDYGYRRIGSKYSLKRDIDHDLAEGKLIKIHSYE